MRGPHLPCSCRCIRVCAKLHMVLFNMILYFVCHSLIRSLVHSHRSQIRLLRTTRFARALCCAHSFIRPLTHSLASHSASLEHSNCSWNYASVILAFHCYRCFKNVSSLVEYRLSLKHTKKIVSHRRTTTYQSLIGHLRASLL